MKKTKIAILTILFTIATMAFASQTVTYDDAWNEAGFNLNRISGSGVGITFSINEFSLEDVSKFGICGDIMETRCHLEIRVFSSS